jgi:hypothetical protein
VTADAQPERTADDDQGREAGEPGGSAENSFADGNFHVRKTTGGIHQGFLRRDPFVAVGVDAVFSLSAKKTHGYV